MYTYTQMSYHGYMGTSGADYIDYYLADKVIAPPEHASFFSESCHTRTSIKAYMNELQHRH